MREEEEEEEDGLIRNRFFVNTGGFFLFHMEAFHCDHVARGRLSVVEWM